jgi:hypothetical protein
MAPAPIKCKNTEPYTTRVMCGEFTWLVYNKTHGYIVAATYDEDMAKALLTGIRLSWKYNGDYGITEMWKSPEPMIG